MYAGLGLLRTALAPGVFTDDSGPPTDVTHTAADLSDEQLTDALHEADATIDSYIGARYQTPVAPDETTGKTPHPIDYWSRNIAVYLATLTFRRGKDLSDSDPVIRRYNTTMANLTAIRNGTAILELPGTADATGSASASAPINPYSGRLFDAEDFALTGTDWPGLTMPLQLGGYWNDYR